MKGMKINYEEMNEDEVIFLLKPIIFKGLEFARIVGSIDFEDERVNRLAKYHLSSEAHKRN